MLSWEQDWRTDSAYLKDVRWGEPCYLCSRHSTVCLLFGGSWPLWQSPGLYEKEQSQKKCSQTWMLWGEVKPPSSPLSPFGIADRERLVDSSRHTVHSLQANDGAASNGFQAPSRKQVQTEETTGHSFFLKTLSLNPSSRRGGHTMCKN